MQSKLAPFNRPIHQMMVCFLIPCGVRHPVTTSLRMRMSWRTSWRMSCRVVYWRPGNAHLLCHRKTPTQQLHLDQRSYLVISVEVGHIILATPHVYTFFFLARKTKCDGAHPACASCARRQLDCIYVYDQKPIKQNVTIGRTANASIRRRKQVVKVGDIHLEPTSRVVTFFVTTRPKREQNRLRHEL